MPIANTTYQAFHDGTSQSQRWMAALATDFAQVDDRTRADLIEEMRCLAPELAYYNDQNQWQGDWSNFIPAGNTLDQLLTNAYQTQQLPPQLAFLLAFLKIFKHAQDHLNEFTGRHLDFYYEEILQIKHREAVPDRVHVFFELARGIVAEKLGAGASLKAGKDADGRPLSYALQEEIVLHPATIVEMRSCSSDDALGGRIFAAPIANSGDGLGAPFPGPQTSWAPLGESQFGKTEDTRSMQEGEIGFIVSSPALKLSGGRRNGEFGLFLTDDHGLIDPDLKDAFRLWLSTDAGWREVKPAYTNKGDDKSIRITWSLSPDFPPITALPTDEELSWGVPSEPAAKLALNHQAPNYLYKELSGNSIQRIHFDGRVEGVKNLRLSNDDAAINADKSFFPFGALPALGSSFYIGSDELLGKRIDSLTLNLQWDKLPTSTGGFADHYTAYPGSRSNTSFRADIAVYTNDNWAGTGTIPLFATTGSGLQQEPYPLAIYSGGFTVKDAERVARLRLANADFGHGEFSEQYAKIALQIANSGTYQDLPNPPYTPKIKSFSLDYSTSFDINFPSQPGVHRFGHLEPFGDFPAGVNTLPAVVASMPKGNLYLGIAGLDRPRQLNVLLQCVEGSSDADAALQTEDVTWHYLDGNTWQPFPSASVLQDGSAGLQKPGIVQLVIERVRATGSRMPGDLFWLRASTEGLPEGAARLLDIRLNGALAQLEQVEQHEKHLENPLAAHTIKRLLEPKPGIKKTEQAFASFGGRRPENQIDYYRRVSERLRHKQRAITAWDYERIVLQAFPMLYKVKCLNHSQGKAPCSPGTVSLVVIPQVDLAQSRDPFQPKASPALREEIREFLRCLIPNLFVDVAVLNPCYEPLEVVAKVKIRAGYDPGFYLEELNRALQRQLAPWAFAEEEDISIGGQIFGSSIIKFMELQPYVDHLCDFQFRHYPCQPCLGDMSISNGLEDYADDFVVYPLKNDPVVASGPSSVLVSARAHLLTLATADDPCRCQEPDFRPCSGIGQMAIEQDFKIT